MKQIVVVFKEYFPVPNPDAVWEIYFSQFSASRDIIWDFDILEPKKMSFTRPSLCNLRAVFQEM